MDSGSVRYKPVTKSVTEVVRGSGPLPDENFMYALTNVYWVSRMAIGLESVIRAQDLDDAHEIARESLRELLDPVDGLRSGIHDDLRLRWRIASRPVKRK